MRPAMLQQNQQHQQPLQQHSRRCPHLQAAVQQQRCVARPASTKQLQPAAVAARSQQQSQLQDKQQQQQQQHQQHWVAPSSLLSDSLPQQQLLLGLAAAAGAAGMLGSGFEVDGPGSVLEALGVLASIIAVHEAGHFTAARAQGIHVSQFAIGFGPPLFSFKRGGVEYSLRAIPLGGYVAFPDDDPRGLAAPGSAYAPDDPDLLQNRSVPQRLLVISAGVIANVVFALAVLFAQVNTVGKAQTAYLPGVLVPEVNAGGAAQAAGFQPGDVILRVGDLEVTASASQVPDVVAAIKAHPNERLDFTVERGKQVLFLPAVPTAGRDGRGAIGVSLLSHTFISHTKPDGLLDAGRMAVGEFSRLAGTVLNGLKQLVTNFGQMAGQLSGPVAIVAAGSEIARTDAAGLFQFCAIVNINLAIVNVLPLPALDGGYLVLLLLEAARGKKLPEGVEQGVMASGLLMMMFLGVGLVIRDTVNLLN